MSDPLSEVVRLLRPQAVFANVISGKGDWAVRYAKYGLPSFCIVLDGSARLAVRGHAPITIGAGDFVLLPTTPSFTLSSATPAPAVHLDPHEVASSRRELRYGDQSGEPDMRSVGGAFLFESDDPALLVSLLPTVVHIRDSPRLSRLVQMVGEETMSEQPGSEYMRSRVAELLLVEAMRACANGAAPPGLLRGLGDAQLSRALTQLHAAVHSPWTIEQLAGIAAMSRSAFCERFTRLVGVAPMAYLLSWRMQIARRLLRDEALPVQEVATRVGYGSTSAFSVAFSRHVGEPPSVYARGE